MKSRIYFFNWFQFAFDDGYFSDRCLVVEVPMKFILIMKRFQISLPTFFWVPRAFPKMIYWAQFSKKKEWTVFLIAFVRLQPIMYNIKLWSKINLTSFCWTMMIRIAIFFQRLMIYLTYLWIWPNAYLVVLYTISRR